MKNIKKLLILALVCILSATLFVSCGNKTENPKDTTDTHTHTSSGDWEVDKENHWKLCDTDKEICEKAAHSFENDFCTTCNVQLIEDDDTTGSLTFYNEKEEWIKLLQYNEEGIFETQTAEYTYDENGNKLTMTWYKNGELAFENTYGLNDDGYEQEMKSIMYIGAAKSITEYNTKSDVILEAAYDESGNLTSETKYEYTYDEVGNRLTMKTYQDQKLVSDAKYIIAFEDSWGGKIWYTEITTYNEDGTTTVETYDENGNPVVK